MAVKSRTVLGKDFIKGKPKKSRQGNGKQLETATY